MTDAITVENRIIEQDNMMPLMDIDLAQLAEPFNPDKIEFRVGATNKEKTKALALAYITSRSVMDRLDDVCKPENWEDAYLPGPNGGVLCGISIRVKDRWITKWDGADNTKIEGVKGGLTDAFKRAAVKWGIGRYLYGLPDIWVDAKQQGQGVKIDENAARHKMFGNASKQSPKPEVNQNTGEVLSLVMEAPPTTKKEPSDPWPSKTGPVFEFCHQVRSRTEYFDNQYRLSNAVGGFGDLSDNENWNAKLSIALDHAKEKKAAESEITQ